MKFLMQGLLALSFAGSISSMACTIDGKEGFLPTNHLKIFAHQKGLKGGITEEQFNKVIDGVEVVMSPFITQAGGTLKVVKKWTDPTVNAYAQQLGKTWQISMFGGLARHETITEDGMALVACHEIGHHIGGAPRKVSPWASPWASNEGQSDYFATLKCLRHVWMSDDNEAIVRSMEVPQTVLKTCSEQHLWNRDYFMCVRGAMAGMSVAKLFQALRNQTTPPSFDTPDRKVVTKTDDNHPDTQCRLDTYFKGALCEVGHNESVSSTDEVAGTCHGSLGHTQGLRPSCWFKPLVQ